MLYVWEDGGGQLQAAFDVPTDELKASTLGRPERAGYVIVVHLKSRDHGEKTDTVLHL